MKGSFSVLFVLVFLVFIVFIWYNNRNYNYSHRITNSRYYYRVLKESVEWYKKETGAYPKSLDNITKYAKEIGVAYREPGVSSGDVELFLPEWHREFISTSEGNSTEHSELNNEGGYYYNNKTGEVKINLTQPIEAYLKGYNGIFKGHIPAGWKANEEN